VERLVVGYLLVQLTSFGHVRLPLREILLHSKLNGKKKNEFLDAIERLEKRRIMKIETL